MRKSLLIIALFAIALGTQVQISSAEEMKTVTANSNNTTVPPAGGVYQPDYGHQNYKIGISGFSVGNAVEVQSVFPGTAASRLTLEAGDRIVMVNGMSTPNISTLRAALRNAVQYSRGHITVLIDNVRARRGEYGAQRWVRHATYLTNIPGGGGSVSPGTYTPPGTYFPPQSGPMIVTPNRIDGYDPNTGTLHSSNIQVNHSANAIYRDQSRSNGTMRYVKRPIYDQFGTLVGYQEGQVWNNSLTGQEHGNLNNTTIDGNGNVHRQRQITSGR